MVYHNKNKGFTLAEVLITLGIIGVVSALTLPNLIADFQKKQTATKLKTTYSFLNQAYQASIVDNGEVENWDWKNLDLNYYDSFGRKYILPYLKGKNKAPVYSWYSLNGERTSIPFHRYMLSNGMILGFWGLNFTNDNVGGNKYKTHLIMFIDINGAKRPNKLGKDIFTFSIFPFVKANTNVMLGSNEQCYDGALHYTFTREQLLTQGCATCKSGTNGYGCSAVIMKDGWEIKDDYPW